MVQRNFVNADKNARIAEYAPKLISMLRSQENAIAGKYTPTTSELIAGWDFRGGSFEIDAIEWSRSLTNQDRDDPIRLPKAVLRRVEGLHQMPHRFAVVTLRRAALKRRPEWSASYCEMLDRIVRRCTVYLAWLGDTAARDWMGQEALRQLKGHSPTPIAAELLRAGLAGIAGLKPHEISYHIQTWLKHDEVLTMSGTSDSLQAWLDDYTDATLARAAHREALEDAIPNDDDLLPPPSWTVQNRIVVPAFFKIPKADNPKHEFHPIAGKPLPLTTFGGDVAKVSDNLCRRWPWAAETIRALLMDLVGQPWIRFRPTILLGPPGTGKSSLALEIARAVGLAPTLYSAAGNADGSFGGTSAQWSTARGSVSVQAVLRSMSANPVVLIDEIEKSGSSRRNGNLQDVVLTLVEPVTARCVLDPCLEAPVDLSHVSYLATANSLDGVSAPLRDRFRILSVPAPGPEHLLVVAGQILHAIRVERATTDDWLPDLDGDELGMLAEHWQGGSMRAVRRMVETLVATRETFALRH